MAAPFQDARVIVAVSGGIAAFKSAALVSKLAQAGAQVTVLMTESATKFVAPLTFQALSGRPVYISPWQHIESQDPQHIALAKAADAAIVAPCTMDTLARLVHGFAGDVVTLALSAIDRQKTPVLLAPSMNEIMWSQPSTRRNVEQAVADGYTLVGPGDGWQACRAVGAGRMAEVEELMGAIEKALAGRKR